MVYKMKRKIILIFSICLFGSQAAQAEPSVYSYTYLPRGATIIETAPGLNVEPLNNESYQEISIFNTSARDNFIHNQNIYTPMPFIERLYQQNRDRKNWIGLYASASKTRDYTLLITRPNRAFTAVDSDQITANGSTEIKKKLRYNVTGSGHVKIKIPYIMKTVERRVLAEKNWEGTGRYINVIFGALSQPTIGENSRIEIDNGFIEQHSKHERSMNPSGKYEVTVSTELLTNEGLELPFSHDTDKLKNHKKDIFILEGDVQDGVLELELTLNTLAFLDYSITLEKHQ